MHHDPRLLPVVIERYRSVLCSTLRELLGDEAQLHKGGVGIHGKGGRLAGYFEGDVEVTGDLRLLNADCAEDFDVVGTTHVEPGTVMVLSDESALSACATAYD
jgi:hypothetical protein